MIHIEEVKNSEYIARVKDLERRGAKYFKVKVLKHNSGYQITCTIDDTSNAQPELLQSQDMF